MDAIDLTPEQSLLSFSPSPLSRYLIAASMGVALGVWLGMTLSRLTDTSEAKHAHPSTNYLFDERIDDVKVVVLDDEA